MKIFPIALFMAGLCTVSMPGSTIAAEENEVFVFAYRLLETQTKEFEDAKKGEAFVNALTKLGCKAKSEPHEGHLDVTYQQLRWTLVTLQTGELVHKWVDWVNDAGGETLHSEDPEHHEEHDADHKHEHEEDMEVIAFQTTDWIEKHFEKAGAGAEFVVVCKALGCEYKEDIHDGHADVTFRCLKSRTIECAGHEAAEKRAEWLTEIGFSVKHDH